MKIITIIGARPQFIKAAAVSTHLKNKCEEVLIHTGQHYDQNMSDIFFQEMEIPDPQYHLGIGGGTHGEMTGNMLIKIESVLQKEKPDLVLVYGDTNSTLAGALAAVKLHIPVAHVEAGMRSFNRKMPEEINRILTDQISSLLFTPTPTATQNLIHEGYERERIHEVGDVMFDGAIRYQKEAENRKPLLKKLEIEPKKYCLATIHRAENTDSKENMNHILSAFIELSKQLPLIWPIHPRARKLLKKYELWDKASEHLRMIDPIGYLDILLLEKEAKLIITDSGGMQKEAFFNCTPCLTIRSETEWTELVDLGLNQLVEANQKSILAGVEFMMAQKIDWQQNLYGQGTAAKKIVEALLTMHHSTHA